MREVRFIEANTKLLPVPLVPEISLHLAEESLAIWQKTEEDLGRMNVPPPWWAFAWAGGQALARYVLDTPAVADGRAVLDLGAGSGLGAIAAAMAGAASVLAADTDPYALAAVALNAKANGVTVEATGRGSAGVEPGEVRRGLGRRHVLRAAARRAGARFRRGGARPGCRDAWWAIRAAATFPMSAFGRSPSTLCP